VLRRLIGDRVDQLTILDGSGLSYGNQGSATAMVEVLSAMHRTSMRDTFYDSLRDTRDDRRLPNLDARVKTGTLAVASCLVGYVNRTDGRRLAFAILLGKGTSRDFSWAPRLRDRVFRLLGG
jgi:D-alanyl-D-alanine carboxypeptidase